MSLRERFCFEMLIICTIIGERRSCGARCNGIDDSILILEYAVYTVATLEACFAVRCKNSRQSVCAVEAYTISFQDLKVLQEVDEIVQQPLGDAQADSDAASKHYNQERTKRAFLSKLQNQA